MTTFKDYTDYNYDFYLFARLCLDKGLIDKNAEYEIAFDATIRYYEEFVDSDYNDLEEPYYDCIVDFIKYKLERI